MKIAEEENLNPYLKSGLKTKRFMYVISVDRTDFPQGGIIHYESGNICKGKHNRSKPPDAT